MIYSVAPLYSNSSISLINKDPNIERTYKVLRLHDGVVEELEVKVNGKTATFEITVAELELTITNDNYQYLEINNTKYIYTIQPVKKNINQ